MGCIEREHGTLYCTVLFFDGANGLVGKHRKLMPTAGERLIWGFGDGSTMPAFETSLGTIGAVICWENYMPALRMHMYSQGVSIYCAPTADDRDTWVPSMQHIALEGRCFVLTACKVLVGPDFDGETILYADIDLDDIARGKYDFDATGHYSRPDVFQLTVDTRPKSAVSTIPALPARS